MLSVQSVPPVQTSFPSVHAFIMLEGTMNLTGEMQPLVEQLMMIKRIQVGLVSALSVHGSVADPLNSSCAWVFCSSEFQRRCLSLRSGKLASLGSSSLQKAQRSSNGLPLHSSRSALYTILLNNKLLNSVQMWFWCSAWCLQIPQVLLRLKKYPQGEKVSMSDTKCFTRQSAVYTWWPF